MTITSYELARPRARVFQYAAPSDILETIAEWLELNPTISLLAIRTDIEEEGASITVFYERMVEAGQ